MRAMSFNDEKPIHTFCVAPMMDWTDRHYRYLARLLSRHAYLYTEMVTTGAILHGDKDRFLRFNPEETPVALQLGGSDAADLARCARLGEQWGYDEINLNVGCPSDRVSSGRFGACLMAEPETVAQAVAAMKAAVDLPVTVKCRIGIDAHDSYAYLRDFVGRVVQAGIDTLIVHARKAWLSGLSPKENREVPPLDYPRVHRLAAEFPDLSVIINGGFTDLESAMAQLEYVDGVMLGRAAYQQPGLLARVDRLFYGSTEADTDIRACVLHYCDYVESQLSHGVRLPTLIKPLLGLFAGQPGARQWRRHLSEQGHQPGAGTEVIHHALTHTR